jgi:Tol biopolymer transport system component
LTRPSMRLLILALVLGASCVALRPAAAQIEPQWEGEGFGKNKVQYRDFKWEIYHSPHFNMYYYKGEEQLLQKMVSYAESAYDDISRELNFQIKDPIPLLYYSTHSAFEQNNVILNFIPEGVGAFASPARFRMVMPVDVPDAALMKLIRHELTHIFQYHMLFQGSLAKAVASSPPTWFMEGMASYVAKDETARDKMYLRDAVVNDQIPSVKQDFGGFFAYRYGHAFFDFVEERWGREGFLDFLYEIRNTIGARVDRAVQRAFKMDSEDFDAEFRRWLRKRYLQELVVTGEPGDFGRRFRVEEQESNAWVTSPAASPSGDLVAALSSYRGDIDVVVFDAKKRRLLRNLTKGYTNDYQYLVGQELALGRTYGRDLSFSPDGNTIAIFAKRERARSLILIDVLNGGVRRIIDMGTIEQPYAPSWSPDGKTIVFSGNEKGKFDIFLLDVESAKLRHFTDDDIYDGAPVFTPDGKSIVYISVVGNGSAKIFRSPLDNPGQRFQLTTGDTNENDPLLSPDGKRLYFTSDRDGRDNVYGIDLATGQTHQYTNVVTGAFMPTVLQDTTDKKERLVFTGYWKSRMDLYVTDVDQPVKEAAVTQLPTAPSAAKDIPHFEPDIQVTLDDANKERYSGRKFFLEDAQTYIGVDSNQTYLGRVLLTFSDYLGDRRILADLSSVESFSNFNIAYADLSHRTQWEARLFDIRTFFIGQDAVTGQLVQGKTASRQTGVSGSLIYPFSFYNRAEIGTGYVWRDYFDQRFAFVPGFGIQPVLVEVKDNFPVLTGALAGDTSLLADWGPIAGHRWRLDGTYAPDLHQKGALMTSAVLDARQYIPLSLRSNLALRLWGAVSNGNAPNLIIFGGLDTIRGTDFRTLVGDRGFFANVEYRFPLIDVLATPVLAFRGLRGNIFFDIGGAWLHKFQHFQAYSSDEGRLKDAIASYGYGLTVRFIGLDLNWDFAKETDFKKSNGGYRTSFWIGTRF